MDALPLPRAGPCLQRAQSWATFCSALSPPSAAPPATLSPPDSATAPNSTHSSARVLGALIDAPSPPGSAPGGTWFDEVEDLEASRDADIEAQREAEVEGLSKAEQRLPNSEQQLEMEDL